MHLFFGVCLLLMRSTNLTVNQLLKYLIFLITIFHSQVFADEASLENVVSMTIKPKLCILNNVRQNCDDIVIISWKAHIPRTLCLYASFQSKVMTCWPKSLQGKTEQKIKTQESILFLLKQQELVVAQQSIKVIKNFNPRKRRARKRHPWSIF